MSERRYLAVAGRLRKGELELRDVVERALLIWEAGERDAPAWYVDAVALNMHGYYAGIEQLLALVAESVDETLPAGADWHRALLEQMCAEIRGLRPPVLRDATRRQLDRLRGFRHVVRNVYAMHMEADQMRDLVADLPAASRAVSEDLLAFAAWLESVALAEPDEDTPRG